ncbi:hypothetical protein NW765_016345 [Fusarium oxysporum]|nr:hypothetical protein NW765_016345 [Fusarium oxysporum]
MSDFACVREDSANKVAPWTNSTYDNFQELVRIGFKWNTITVKRHADDVLPIKEEERPICEDWLRPIGFLVPGQDEGRWHAIVENWERFLKATNTRIIGSGASRRVK